MVMIYNLKILRLVVCRGYGRYPINYKVFTNHTNRYEGSISSCSINVTRLNPPTPAMYIVPTEYVNTSIDMPEYKIRVTGVNDSTHFCDRCSSGRAF